MVSRSGILPQHRLRGVVEERGGEGVRLTLSEVESYKEGGGVGMMMMNDEEAAGIRKTPLDDEKSHSSAGCRRPTNSSVLPSEV
jgi:hypothetical protein